MTVNQLVRQLDNQLAALGTPERAAQEKAYLKSDLRHYGVSVPETRKVARAFAGSNKGLDHDGLVELITSMWSIPIYERRSISYELLHLFEDRLVADDIKLLERLLRESHTWALVDPLAGIVVGDMVVRFPKLTTTLDRWASDEDFWIRRSAMLALLVPLRSGGGDFERFGRFADAMLEEKEFFIRKAIGWILRDTGKKRPDLVFDWILPRAARASGVTLREAVKPLSDEQRQAVLAAR